MPNVCLFYLLFSRCLAINFLLQVTQPVCKQSSKSIQRTFNRFFLLFSLPQSTQLVIFFYCKRPAYPPFCVEDHFLIKCPTLETDYFRRFLLLLMLIICQTGRPLPSVHTHRHTCNHMTINLHSAPTQDETKLIFVLSKFIHHNTVYVCVCCSLLLSSRFHP